MQQSSYDVPARIDSMRRHARILRQRIAAGIKADLHSIELDLIEKNIIFLKEKYNL